MVINSYKSERDGIVFFSYQTTKFLLKISYTSIFTFERLKQMDKMDVFVFPKKKRTFLFCGGL
jgi:hypothetical protein